MKYAHPPSIMWKSSSHAGSSLKPDVTTRTTVVAPRASRKKSVAMRTPPISSPHAKCLFGSQ
jgi:hypothetical protein